MKISKNTQFMYQKNVMKKKYVDLILIEALREKCPNREFFLVRIFQNSDLIWKDRKYLSTFSSYVGKYGPEKFPYLYTFHAVKRKERDTTFVSKIPIHSCIIILYTEGKKTYLSLLFIKTSY